MKTERNILIAFILNLAFALFEFVGGMLTGSVAIISDAIHDIGDAASIGVSYALEKKSKRPPDGTHTYGYARYSVIGGAITTLILLLGSLMVIYNAINRILHPTDIHYDGMLIFAIVGVAVNFGAAYFTREGDSVNQKAVNLHMLEDVLGWLVILVGAIVIRFTHWVILDPLMSIGVALFILYHAAGQLKRILQILLEKTPAGITPESVTRSLPDVEGVQEIHHIHLWTLDGYTHCATLHVVTDADSHTVKDVVRKKLRRLGILHAVLELETPDEHCHERECQQHTTPSAEHHQHHHH